MRSIIFIDANIWIGTNLLRTADAASLMAYLLKTDSKILCSHALRSEIIRNAKADIEVAHRDAKEALRSVFWKLGLDSRQAQIPDVESASASIQGRLERLSPFLLTVSPPSACYERAHHRVLNKVAPSHGEHQQYKDAFLLEELLAVTGFEERILITQDGDFWESRSSDSLHPALDASGTLRGFRSLNAFLGASEMAVVAELEPRHRLAIVELVYLWLMGDAIHEEIYLDRNDAKSADAAKLDAFYTTEPGNLAVDFRVPLYGTMRDEEGEDHASTLTLFGSLMIELPSAGISNFEISRSILETTEELIADVDWTATVRTPVLRPLHKLAITRARTPR